MQWLAFAQSLSGGAGWEGWAGAGLLGAVLAWLMFKHLPDKDRQLAEKDAAHEKRMAEKDAAHAAMLAEKDKQIVQFVADKDRAIERKDAQIEAVLARKGEQIERLLAAHDVQIKVMHAENRAQMEQVIQHCKDENLRTSESLQHDLNHLGVAIEELTVSVKELAPPRKRRPALPPEGQIPQE